MRSTLGNLGDFQVKLYHTEESRNFQVKWYVEEARIKSRLYSNFFKGDKDIHKLTKVPKHILKYCKINRNPQKEKDYLKSTELKTQLFVVFKKHVSLLGIPSE